MNDSRPAAWRIPAGLLGMIALILLAEGYITRNQIDFRHPWGWDWMLADHASRKNVKDCDVLLFGDSLVKYGLAPRVIEERSDLRVYNLAVGAGQVPGSYFLLRKAIESGARPKAVVIDTIPHLLADGVRSNATIWPELLSIRDTIDLSLRDHNLDFCSEMLTTKALPSARDRDEIRRAILTALRGETSPLRGGMGMYFRNWRVNQGSQMSKKGGGLSAEELEKWATTLSPPSWKPNPLNTHFLREFIRLAESHRIQVYWIIPPFAPAVQARRDQTGRDVEFEGFIRGVQAKHPNVVVLDARRSEYLDDVHLDALHLDCRGAASLSRDLGDLLRHGRPPATWVSLPKYREVTPLGPIEDIEQSALAVRNRQVRR